MSLKGIADLLIMIPKGGKYAKSVVNFVHKAPKNWVKFKAEIEMFLNLLKGGKLKLHGKQKTNLEANKNILKTREKVIKDAGAHMKKEFASYTKTKEDPFKGWTPGVVKGGKKFPPEKKYSKEMDAIDEELNELMSYGKYDHLPTAERAKIFQKLQAEMKAAMKEDLTTLSLSQINKRSQSLQKRIREISNDPNIKGTVTEGPKADMIDAIYKSENAALTDARKIITRKNSIKKYGDKFPVLDPENNAFIITGLDSSGNPMKVGRWSGRFSATKDTKTGELTRKEGTSYYDKWDSTKNQMRKEGEEVFHETVNAEGKTIMSNPDYKVTTKNMEIWNELYSDMSTSDLAKKGFKLKDIDMLMKGREVKKYLTAQEAGEKGLDTGIKMHERTNTNEISNILEDLYFRGDDIYKMSVKEWITKIPEHFAEGGRIGFKRGLTSAPWLRGRSGSSNIKAWRGSEGWKQAQKLAKKFNLKSKAQTTGILAVLLAAVEAGTIGMDKAAEMLGNEKTGLYKPSDFPKMYKEYMAQRELLKRYEAFKTRGGPEMQEDYKSGYYKEHMPKIDLGEDKEYGEPKDYVFPTEKRNKHATGGISNLFRQRQGFQDGTTMDLKYINPAFDTSEGMLSGVGGFPIVPAAVSGIALALSQKDKDKKAPQKTGGPKLPDPKPPFKIGDLIIDFIVANRRQPTPSEELRLKEILRVAKEKAQKSVSKDRKLTKDELDDLYEEFDEAVPYPMETVGDKEKFLKAVKDEEAYMFQQYKKGNLDPKPGEPGRKQFLEKKLEEAELSGDKRLITRDEIEELSSFDLGTEMDEAIKKDSLRQEIKKGVADVMKDTSEAGLAKSIEIDNLKLEFPGISDELIENILVDMNPQRIAEVKQTMREALKMGERGMSPDDIINAFKDTTRTKQATGGLIPGYATGGVSNLFREKFANGTDFWDQPEMPDPRYRQVYKSLEDIPQDALLMMMKDPNFDLNTFLNTVRWSKPEETRFKKIMEYGKYSKEDIPWGSAGRTYQHLNYLPFGEKEKIGGVIDVDLPSDEDKAQTIMHEMRHTKMDVPWFWESKAVPQWVRDYHAAGGENYLDKDIKDEAGVKGYRDTQQDVSGEELYNRYLDQYFYDVAGKKDLAGSDYKPYFDKILREHWEPHAKAYKEIIKAEKEEMSKPVYRATGGVSNLFRSR